VFNGIGRELEVEAPAQGDMKQTFTTCKIAFGDMLGNAAWRHEKRARGDTVTAYERAIRNKDAIPAWSERGSAARNEPTRWARWELPRIKLCSNLARTTFVHRAPARPTRARTALVQPLRPPPQS